MGLDSRLRLFVAGTTISTVLAVLVDSRRRPTLHLDEPDLLGQTATRGRLSGTRVYLCLERTLRGGEVLTSHFVRAKLIWPLLLVECHRRALGPLSVQLRDRTTAAAVSWPRSLRTLVTLPAAVPRDLPIYLRRRAQLKVQRHRVSRGGEVDRGAWSSIRAAVEDWGPADPHLVRDAEAADTDALILSTLAELCDTRSTTRLTSAAPPSQL
jgi:hypothetical protein